MNQKAQSQSAHGLFFQENLKIFIFAMQGKDYLNSLTVYFINTYFDASTTDSLWKHRNEQFLLFPQCFLLNQKVVSPFFSIYEIISLFAAELEEPKIGI